MSRFRLLVVAVVAAFSLVLQGVVPAGAVESGVHYSGEAADYLSARVQAASSGKRVLVGSALDEFSTTWVNPDGTRTTEAFGSPIRVRDEGGHFGWRDLDFTLVENVDGTVGARSGLLPLSISGGGSAEEVASITQSGVSTVYGFDAVGRRLTETTGGSVLTKHYTASSDNPAWSSNNAGVIDFYVNSLGTGLNGTVHVDNGVKTVSLDVNDLRGNTVTRINLDTATTDSWVSFDEYGNRDTASTGKLVTYDAYGQYERATTSQGLILMGARVYNPVTNQFTSPDPITGGNETTYTYPNDPINKTDFTGLLALLPSMVIDFLVGLLANAIAAALCGPVFSICALGIKMAIGAATGAIITALEGGSIEDVSDAALGGALSAVIPGASAKILKKAHKSLKGVNKKLYKKTKFLRKKKRNEKRVDSVMKFHGFASATYTSVSQGNKLENWKDEFLWNH